MRNKYFCLLFLIFILTPVFAFATISQNLYFGMVNNAQVAELQQFLIGKGFLTSKATGRFYAMTLDAVKKYQASKNIRATGYVGPATRQAIISDLSGKNVLNNPADLKGSLVLAQNAAYKSQTVLAPQTKLKLADFSLKNSTNETVNLNKVEIDFAVGSNLYITNIYLTNVYLVYGEKTAPVFFNISHINNFPIDYSLPAGQTIDLQIFGDVNNSIPLSSTINTSLLVSGVSADSATNVFTNSNKVFSGQGISFGAGSFSASSDGSGSAPTLIPAGQKIVAGKFKFSATNDSYIISELKFIVPANSVSAVTDAILTDSATQALMFPKPIPVFYNGSFNVLDFAVNIPVAANSSKSVTVSYDLNPDIGAASQANIAPVLAYVKAQNSKGDLMDGVALNYYNLFATYKGITLPAAGITANPLYIFKSVPTILAIAQNGAVASNDSDADIYKFSISADKNGDLSVKQITFSITINDPAKTNAHLNSFKFLKNGVDYSNSVAIGNIINKNYIEIKANNGVGIGLANNVVVTFLTEEKIPAGQTQAYSLRAHFNNFGKSDSVSTSMPTDSSMTTGGSKLRSIFANIYFGLSQSYDDSPANVFNFLWSDRSSPVPNYHSDFAGNYTNDWYNGYKVLNLPLANQTVAAKN